MNYFKEKEIKLTSHIKIIIEAKELIFVTCSQDVAVISSNFCLDNKNT